MGKGILVGASVLALAASVACGSEFNMNVQLQDLELGPYVCGPKLSTSDLKNHVVLAEFWGVHCPPCIASLPKLDKWQKDHEAEGLIVLGIHAQGGPASAVKSTATDKGATFSIYLNGEVKNGHDFRGIPHLFIFDHSGKCVFRGNPHDQQCYKVLKETLTKAPFAALAGKELVKMKSLGEALKKGLPVATAIEKAKAAGASPDAATAEEAKFIVDSLTTWGKAQIERARAQKADDVLGCWSGLQEVVKTFQGTEVATEAAQAIAELKIDNGYMTELAAWQALQKIQEVEKELKPVRASDGDDITSDKFKKRNAIVLKKLIAGIQMMKKKYSDSAATTEAEAIASKYNL